MTQSTAIQIAIPVARNLPKIRIPSQPPAQEVIAPIPGKLTHRNVFHATGQSFAAFANRPINAPSKSQISESNNISILYFHLDLRSWQQNFIQNAK
jgi:hypothetical protein